MLGIRTPLQSHPLQALVSELLEPVHPTIVMSNAVHVYVSQAHKGELVMGAGVDSYNGYGQRGAFHIIERQMAAAVELFPVFARAHLLRTWAGIVDVCPDASPIVGRTAVREPVPQRRLGHRRIQGDPGIWAGAWPTRSPTTSRTSTSPRSASTGSSPARWSTNTAPPASRTDPPRSPQAQEHTMQLIECPWCGPREETEFHYGGEAHVAYPEDPQALTDEQWAHYVFFRRQPEGPVRGAVEPQRRLPPLVQRRARHRHLPIPPRVPHRTSRGRRSR